MYVACGPEPDEKGCNVWSYDLAQGASAQLTSLVRTEDDRWYVQEAHVLPGGDAVVFYGNHTGEVGASGNGLQWWWLPAGGGEAQLFSQGYGNGVSGYELAPAPAISLCAIQAYRATQLAARTRSCPASTRPTTATPMCRASAGIQAAVAG